MLPPLLPITNDRNLHPVIVSKLNRGSLFRLSPTPYVNFIREIITQYSPAFSRNELPI